MSPGARDSKEDLGLLAGAVEMSGTAHKGKARTKEFIVENIVRYWNSLCETHGSVKSFLEFSLEDSCVRNFTNLKKYWT